MQKHIAVWGSHWSDPFALQFLLFECSHTLALSALTASSQAVEVESVFHVLSMDGNHESHDRAMIILKAPSPGGPVEVFDIPDSPGGGGPVEVEGFEEEEEESGFEEEGEESGPAVALSRPSSSSPATTTKKETWQGWEPDLKKFQIPQPPRNPEPETRTLLLKGAGNRWEPYEYNPQEVLYEQGACNNIAAAVKDILQEKKIPYGFSHNPRALKEIIKNLTNPYGNMEEWDGIVSEIEKNKSSSPFFRQVFEELKKQKKV